MPSIVKLEVYMPIVKFLWSLVINLDLIAVAILVLGLFYCSAKKQKLVIVVPVILLVFMLGDWKFSGRDILRSLEAHYPAIEVPNDAYGIVITGGSLCLFETKIRGAPVYHKTAGRLVEALKIAHILPQTTIIFAGSKIESDEFLKLAIGIGITSNRIKVVSSEAVNSLEDAAIEAVKLAGNGKSKKWLLVTSAYTMPRTMNVFKASGWDLTPFPVDFHTIGIDKTDFITRLSASFVDRLGLLSWNIAWREIAGLSNLYISGKTNSFFPKNDANKT